VACIAVMAVGYGVSQEATVEGAQGEGRKNFASDMSASPQER
jgi:hypothetical protein